MVDEMALAQFATGWVKDPVAVKANFDVWRAKGMPVTASDYATLHKPDLKGYWKALKALGVTGVFLSDASETILGKPRRPFLQEHGTCVDRGCTAGVQLSLDYAIANKIIVARPVTIQFGTFYVGSRVDIGHNQLGNQEGAILGQAMTCYHDIGCMEKKDVGQWKFLTDKETAIENEVVRLSTKGLPDEWKKEMKGHGGSVFYCEELERIFDCVAAGFGCPYAFDYVTGNPNKAGLSSLGSYGPHCRCFSGVYVDADGNDQLVSKESWGRFPAGQPMTNDRTMDTASMPRITILMSNAKGQISPRILAPGEVGVNAKKFAAGIYDDGEVYAVGYPNGFQPEGLAALINEKPLAS